MKQSRMYGLLVPAVLLFGVATVGAEQYGVRDYPPSQQKMEQDEQRSEMRRMEQERGAKGPIRSGAVECKDSILCQQKNPSWTERSNYLEPLRIDPSTGYRTHF